MDTALFVGLAHKTALRRRMDVTANNIANMSTTAFKKERVAFKEYLMDVSGSAGAAGDKISFVQDYAVVRNLDQGQMVPTSNPLDIYINGRGYLTAEGRGGETLYTRNGRLKIDEENYLSLYTGERILDETGQAIQIPDQDKEIHIAADGTLTTDQGQIAKLGVATFQNEGQMKRQGNSLYSSDENPLPPETAYDVKLEQRALESSNVNAVESMVEMIDVLRSYQRAVKQGKEYEDMRQNSLDRLARVQ
ncbi:flagellar basal-body rod protein FlgF [Kordiimonas sediminis]|uniref:Flagellar basal-body rod protein FlgF n=1 Tax=Kordiimonas sediminis TaxID=1735581 RepID=A0A919AW93_9PROT|nr:flagellar hook basal-body protein [Kordiimonas sediminis]GHF29377.1 flagellar basal-body rod protein FlgF [Kordiimonas sediminis]